MTKQQKTVTAVVVFLIIILVGIAFAPLVASFAMGAGIKVDELNTENTSAATTDVDGEWTIEQGTPANITSVGYTFAEILPNERTVTSGLTQSVEGGVTIESGVLTAGEVIIDMDTIDSDKPVRDVNTRNKLFETTDYPTATFEITEPADVSHLPDDGSASTVELTGELTIKDNTHEVTETFDVVRDGSRVIVAGDILINRMDYGVDTPEFLAAEIAEEGEINVLLSMVKEDA